MHGYNAWSKQPVQWVNVYFIAEAPKLQRWFNTMDSEWIGIEGGKFLLSQSGKHILLDQ
jgi:hypothetical protein